MHTVLHVSPHPDDESIAAPCTLLTLRDAGWRVVNFAVSMGRPEQAERRRAELRGALELAGFEHREPTTPIGISRGDRHGRACRALIPQIRNVVEETGAELVVGPHPRDSHHGHATVARAVREVVWAAGGSLTWWMWSVWADLPHPTLIVNCDPKHLQLSREMLDQHVGEYRRVDYRLMHEPVRQVNAIRGIEKVLGYGATPDEEHRRITHAELLTELTVRGRTWMEGRPRILRTTAPTSVEWDQLDDTSILSSTRLRPLYRAILLSASARYRWRITVAP